MMLLFFLGILLLPLTVDAGQVVYTTSTGQVLGYRETPKPLLAGQSELIVPSEPTWPAPPPGDSWTSCATGSRDWTLVVAGALQFNSALTIFRCEPVADRAEVLRFFNARTGELNPVTQTLVNFAVGVTLACPVADVSTVCINARALRNELATVIPAGIVTLYTEAQDLITAKGWQNQ